MRYGSLLRKISVAAGCQNHLWVLGRRIPGNGTGKFGVEIDFAACYCQRGSLLVARGPRSAMKRHWPLRQAGASNLGGTHNSPVAHGPVTRVAAVASFAAFVAGW
jgi:hypothetical protein